MNVYLRLLLSVALLGSASGSLAKESVCEQCSKPAPLGWRLCQKCRNRKEADDRARILAASRDSVREVDSIVPGQGPLTGPDGRALVREARIPRLCGFTFGAVKRLPLTKTRVNELGELTVEGMLKTPFRSCGNYRLCYARQNQALTAVELWSEPVGGISEARALTELKAMEEVFFTKFKASFDPKRPIDRAGRFDQDGRFVEEAKFRAASAQRLSFVIERKESERRGVLHRDGAPKLVTYIFKIELRDELVPSLTGSVQALHTKDSGADAL